MNGNRVTPHEIGEDRITLLGFWVYLMTDLVLFASLFATYMVLRTHTAGGPSGADIFDLPFAFKETLVLLASSFTAGIALTMAASGRVQASLSWLGATGLLGTAFVILEVAEFLALVAHGNGPGASAFLSAYFTLVGTHGLHVTLGLAWMCALAIAICRKGLVRGNLRRLALLAMFWHFLDIVWIFIFTIVYLMAIV